MIARFARFAHAVTLSEPRDHGELALDSASTVSRST
jgi:hypothetical protein